MNFLSFFPRINIAWSSTSHKKKKKLHGKKIQSKYGNLCFNYIQIKMIPFLQRWFKIMKWMTDEYFHAPHKFLIRRRRRISLFTVLSVSVFLFHAQSLSQWNLTNSASNFEGELKKHRWVFIWAGLTTQYIFFLSIYIFKRLTCKSTKKDYFRTT